MSHQNPLEALPEFTKLINTADPRLGAKALFATDEFFAPKERLLNPEPAVFIDGKYDDHGKWMDGWETRRKRVLGHDDVIVQLAKPAYLYGADIDTSHFTGNYPTACQLDGVLLAEDVDTTQWTHDTWQAQDWQTLIPVTPLKGDSHHYLAIETNVKNTTGDNPHHIVSARDKLVSHVRLSIYPDGGVARLRLYGIKQPPKTQGLVDLVSALQGGRCIAFNDAHFGSPDNMLLPHPAPNMGEGWETRRRREPGHDWCIIALGHPGVVCRIEVDTAFFKGNFPDRVSIQAVYAPNTPTSTLITQSMFWEMLLDEQPLTADNNHEFSQILLDQPITHVRVNIHPDGGISRLRIFGRVQEG